MSMRSIVTSSGVSSNVTLGRWILAVTAHSPHEWTGRTASGFDRGDVDVGTDESGESGASALSAIPFDPMKAVSAKMVTIRGSNDLCMSDLSQTVNGRMGASHDECMDMAVVSSIPRTQSVAGYSCSRMGCNGTKIGFNGRVLPMEMLGSAHGVLAPH